MKRCVKYKYLETNMATHIREAKPKERERTKIEVHARLDKLIMKREIDRGQRSKQ